MPRPGIRRVVSVGPPTLFWKLDAETIAQSDGTAVASWADTSPSAMTVTQGTGARQPIYKTSIVNSLPVVRFTAASSHWMKTATLLNPNLQPGAIFVVCAYASFTNSWLLDGATSASRWVVNVNSGQNPNMNGGTDVTASNTTTGTGFNIITNVFNGGSSAIYFNGAIAASGNGGSMLCDGFHLGTAYIEATYFLDGDVAAVRAYRGAMSAAFRMGVERQLADKYAITLR